jgi:hypothetical protein
MPSGGARPGIDHQQPRIVQKPKAACSPIQSVSVGKPNHRSTGSLGLTAVFYTVQVDVNSAAITDDPIGLCVPFQGGYRCPGHCLTPQNHGCSRVPDLLPAQQLTVLRRTDRSHR